MISLLTGFISEYESAVKNNRNLLSNMDRWIKMDGTDPTARTWMTGPVSNLWITADLNSL